MRNAYFTTVALVVALAACSDDKNADTGNPGDGASEDGSSSDGANDDGASEDGTSQDGTSADGSADGDVGDGTGDGGDDLDGGTSDGGPVDQGDGGYSPGPGGEIDLSVTQTLDCNFEIQPPGPIVGTVEAMGAGWLITIGVDGDRWTFDITVPTSTVGEEHEVDGVKVTAGFAQELAGDTGRWNAASGTITIEASGGTAEGGTQVRFKNVAFVKGAGPSVGTFTLDGMLRSSQRI